MKNKYMIIITVFAITVITLKIIFGAYSYLQAKNNQTNREEAGISYSHSM